LLNILLAGEVLVFAQEDQNPVKSFNHDGSGSRHVTAMEFQEGTIRIYKP
jgi:hypothetical protein